MSSESKTENSASNACRNQPDGYRESIQWGLDALRRFRGRAFVSHGVPASELEKLHHVLQQTNTILIGAGAGLSTSAGLTYSGDRFNRFFFDFAKRYGIQDIYSGGFFPFPDDETRWAWWARHIYFNRYIDPPLPVYHDLLALVRDKNYFVVTTNVDHQFLRAGFDPARLFATQGDYGLFQSANPKDQSTWENEEWVMRAMDAQGFVKDADGMYRVPEDGHLSMRLPSSMIPVNPTDGAAVTTNLRADDTFVEDRQWCEASAAYGRFLQAHRTGPILYLELGIGANTPVIIKYPFWAMTAANPAATYACINQGEAFCPAEIEDRSICLDGDIGRILQSLSDSEADGQQGHR